MKPNVFGDYKSINYVQILSQLNSLLVNHTVAKEVEDMQTSTSEGKDEDPLSNNWK